MLAGCAQAGERGARRVFRAHDADRSACRDCLGPPARQQRAECPRCCTVVIHLHTTVHRLWATGMRALSLRASPGEVMCVDGVHKACGLTVQNTAGWRPCARGHAWTSNDGHPQSPAQMPMTRWAGRRSERDYAPGWRPDSYPHVTCECTVTEQRAAESLLLISEWSAKPGITEDEYDAVAQRLEAAGA